VIFKGKQQPINVFAINPEVWSNYFLIEENIPKKLGIKTSDGLCKFWKRIWEDDPAEADSSLKGTGPREFVMSAIIHQKIPFGNLTR